ncbi:nitroreductase family protein [Lentzea sp. NPDC006480]|uniref:nitroreductase family protein n=1 Tax=Lentzea sp. NPDC006480 TaxID=3157176 RepID=UPI0033B19478
MNTTLRTWRQLLQDDPVPRTGRYEPRSSGLTAALRIVESGVLDSGPGLRAVPSAGAVHPYEILVVADDDGRPALFQVDPARRVCLRTEASPLLLPDPPRGGAHVLLLTRPWLSMRKYGRRGYLYVQLDLAHLATNLLGVALSLGVDAALRLRLPREAMRERLGRFGAHREIHSVLTLGPSPGAAVAGWRFRDGTFRAQDALLDDLESLCWNGLPPGLVDGSGTPNAAVRAPLVAGEGSLAVARWADLSRKRRSSKGFAPGAVATTAVTAVAGTALATDLGLDQDRVVMSVVEPHGADTDHVVSACHDQEHLRHASAFAVFHTDSGDTGAESHLLREDLFRAGAAGQLLYLGAAAERVGVTAVGGFSPRAWRELAGLPAGREVLYLVALGRDGVQTVKLDRGERATAHGE